MKILDAMSETGLVQPNTFREKNIVPVFFRLTAAWKSRPKPSELAEYLERKGFNLKITPSPIRLIYRQSAFLAMYKRLLSSQPMCPEAERQQSLRFCLENAMNY